MIRGGSARCRARPAGPRAALFTPSRYREVAVLVDLLRRVGQEHGGKTPAQARVLHF